MANTNAKSADRPLLKDAILWFIGRPTHLIRVAPVGGSSQKQRAIENTSSVISQTAQD